MNQPACFLARRKTLNGTVTLPKHSSRPHSQKMLSVKLEIEVFRREPPGVLLPHLLEPLQRPLWDYPLHVGREQCVDRLTVTRSRRSLERRQKLRRHLHVVSAHTDPRSASSDS